MAVPGVHKTSRAMAKILIGLDRFMNYMWYHVTARMVIWFAFTSTIPDLISKSCCLSSSAITFTIPLASVEIIAAWFFSISNEPLVPGTCTSFTRASKSRFSGVMISSFTVQVLAFGGLGNDLFTLGDSFFNGANHMECCFGILVDHAVHDHVKAFDGIFDG